MALTRSQITTVAQRGPVEPPSVITVVTKKARVLGRHPNTVAQPTVAESGDLRRQVGVEMAERNRSVGWLRGLLHPNS